VCIDLLLKAGLDMHALNGKKQTPLVRACDTTEVTDGSNFDLASHFALCLGDAKSLFDAVEGATRHGLLPPQVPEGNMRPLVRKAMYALVDMLQQMLAGDNVAQIEEAVELTRALGDSPVAARLNNPSELAVRRIVKLQLQQALDQGEDAPQAENTLKAAIMSARQYLGVVEMVEFDAANAMLNRVMENKMRIAITTQLHNATVMRDLNLLDAAIQRAVQLGYGSLLEVEQAKASIEEMVVENLAQGMVLLDDGLLDRGLSNARRFKLSNAKIQEAAEFKRMLPIKQAMDKLVSALRKKDEASLLEAINMSLDAGDEVKKSPEFSSATTLLRELKGYPENWDMLTVISRGVWKPQMVNLQSTMQKLVSDTFVDTLKVTKGGHFFTLKPPEIEEMVRYQTN